MLVLTLLKNLKDYRHEQNTSLWEPVLLEYGVIKNTSTEFELKIKLIR